MTKPARFQFNTPSWADNLGWDKPQYYSTIQCADIIGNGRAQIFGRSAVGMVGCYFPETLLGATEQKPHYQIPKQPLGNYPIRLSSGPGLTDATGWDEPEYYKTIQFADIDGDAPMWMATVRPNSSDGPPAGSKFGS